MKKSLAVTLAVTLYSLSWSAAAALVEIDTSRWQKTVSPSSESLSQADTWTSLQLNAPTKTSNSSGALVSDFVLNGDFLYSGIMTPTFASNSSCAGELTCDDNDIIGLVFGWQDERNHYRLGWSQGGLSDVTGRTGLFLVREQFGLSQTLMSWANIFWLEEMQYDFSITRSGDLLQLALAGTVSNEPGSQSGTIPTATPTGIAENLTVTLRDTTFLSGRVGVYTESQTAYFSELSVRGTQVHAPATVLLLLWFLPLLFRARHPASV